MTDIALANVMIIWRPVGHPELSPLKIVERPTGLDDDAPDDDDRYHASWGACNGDFNDADDPGKLHMLLVKVVELTVLWDIPARIVHDALIVIPEYRAILPVYLRREARAL